MKNLWRVEISRCVARLLRTEFGVDVNEAMIFHAIRGCFKSLRCRLATVPSAREFYSRSIDAKPVETG